MSFRAVVAPELCEQRLKMIFPLAAFDTVLASPQAARAVAAMIYVGAVVPIDPAHCQFLSAFTSRNSPPARRRLKDIAVGTSCWFLDEPDRELVWTELPRGVS